MDRLVRVKVVRPYVLEVTFSTGAIASVDVEPELYSSVFEPLRDPARFAEARIDPVLGTVVWPNGADLAPEFFAAAASAAPARRSGRR